MALILIIIIMIIGIGIVGSIYTSITPFLYTLGNASNYSIAYYGAIMSVERGLLATRYHDAGFEGRSGFATGNLSDSLTGDFGRLTSDHASNVYRNISSRGTSIPSAGNGDVEKLFAAIDSKNYNELNYDAGVAIPLYLDTTSDSNDYYKGNPVIEPIKDPSGLSNPISLSGTLRLPPKVQSGFNIAGLDTSSDIDGDTIGDDVIVNRGLQGHDSIYDDFTIIPTIKQDFANKRPLYQYDNAIRESIINNETPNVNMESNLQTNVNRNNGLGFSFVSNGDKLSGQNILPLGIDEASQTFDSIINDTNIDHLMLTLELTNRMQTTNNNIYPFLEWQLKGCTIGGNCDVELPDVYYTIQGVGIVGDYTVRIQIKKPVENLSNTSNFTIIF